MRVRLGVILASTITIFVGVTTLLGLLFGSNLVLSEAAGGELVSLFIAFLARLFVQIAVVTVALTVVIGILNLLMVHTSRLFRGRGRTLNRLNSLVLVGVFVFTLGIYIFERSQNTPARESWSRLLLEDVLVTIESSLAALLFFALVYGAFRMLRREVSLYRVLFVVTVLIVLIASLPLPGLGLIVDLYRWLMAVPVSAGARGILLGIALATLVTGVRVLIGQDRSYG